MKVPKKLIEKAVADGAISRMNELLSLAHLLNCISNGLYEEASDLMKSYGIELGLLKKRHSDFVKSADMYFREFASMVESDKQKMAMFEDMDELSNKIRKWSKIDKEYP